MVYLFILAKGTELSKAQNFLYVISHEVDSQAS